MHATRVGGVFDNKVAESKREPADHAKSSGLAVLGAGFAAVNGRYWRVLTADGATWVSSHGGCSLDHRPNTSDFGGWGISCGGHHRYLARQCHDALPLHCMWRYARACGVLTLCAPTRSCAASTPSIL